MSGWILGTLLGRYGGERKAMKSADITFNGETRSLAEWARVRGIKRATLWARINNMNMPLDVALGFSPKPKKKGAYWPRKAAPLPYEERGGRYEIGAINSKGRPNVTRAYRAWQGMKNRCYNKKSPSFKYYGARGIVVCKEWRSSFDLFLRDMGEPPSGHSLERIDNNGSYGKENCKWATAEEQLNNTRRNRFLEYRGERKTIAQWSRELNIGYERIRTRLDTLGWSVEQTLGSCKEGKF